jgi:hypothetical protein
VTISAFLEAGEDETASPSYDQPIPAAVVLVAPLAARQAQPDQEQADGQVSDRAAERRTLEDEGRDRNPAAPIDTLEALFSRELCQSGLQLKRHRESDYLHIRQYSPDHIVSVTQGSGG